MSYSSTDYINFITVLHIFKGFCKGQIVSASPLMWVCPGHFETFSNTPALWKMTMFVWVCPVKVLEYTGRIRMLHPSPNPDSHLTVLDEDFAYIVEKLISQKKRAKHESQFSMLHQEGHNHHLCILPFQLLININRAWFGDLTSLCQHPSSPISDKYQRQLYKYLIWWRLDYLHKLLTADSLYLRLLSLRLYAHVVHPWY